MNYTREQAEEVLRDYMEYFGSTSGFTSNDHSFLDHKFPKKVSGWYRNEAIGNEKYLMYFDFENNNSYGFHVSGRWYDKTDMISTSEYDYLATPQEVEERLIEEAKKRGIVKGAIVANAVNQSTHKIDREPTFRYTSYYSKEELMCDSSSSEMFTAFNNGKWAEIIEQPETELSRTIKKAEKIVDKLNHLLSL